MAEDKLYYDEKKKRFVNTANAPGISHRQYYGGHFKTQRPDLFGQEDVEWRMKLKYGQQLIRQMNMQTKNEMKRLQRTMGSLSYLYFYPLLDDFMSQNAVDRPRILRTWTW